MGMNFPVEFYETEADACPVRERMRDWQKREKP